MEEKHINGQRPPEDDARLSNTDEGQKATTEMRRSVTGLVITIAGISAIASGALFSIVGYKEGRSDQSKIDDAKLKKLEKAAEGDVEKSIELAEKVRKIEEAVLRTMDSKMLNHEAKQRYAMQLRAALEKLKSNYRELVEHYPILNAEINDAIKQCEALEKILEHMPAPKDNENDGEDLI